MKKYFEVKADQYVAGKNFLVYRPASLKNPKNNSVMFIMEKYIDNIDVFRKVKDCLIFWPDKFEIPEDINNMHAVVSCASPHTEFARFFSANSITYLPDIEDVKLVNGAYIAKNAIIGNNCKIFPGVYIGGEVKIGNNVYIGSGAKIVGEVYIGNNVVIRENAVLGVDGLTTDRDENGRALTIPQFGKIIIEDDVQIGVSSIVARGAIDETRICRGSKIDALCWISHNLYIDEDTFVVCGTMTLGSGSIGKRCLVSANSTLMAIHVGDDSIVGAGAVVTKNVPQNSIVKGNPAR